MSARDNRQTPPRRPSGAIRDDVRERQKATLNSILVSNPGMTLTDIATRCGISPSTLTRFMNDPGSTTVLSGPVMGLIETAYGETAASYGMAEAEVRLVAPADGSAADNLGPDTHEWVVGANFSGLPGFLPGDRIRAQMGLPPLDGDVVIVQIEDMRGGATSHLRVFRKGFVLSGTGDLEFVDNVRVRIAAVMVKSWRERAGN